MIRTVSDRAAVLFAAVGVATLLACAPGDSGSQASVSPSADDGVAALAVGRQYAECARAHGNPDFPDPAVADGALTFPGASKDDLGAIQDACGSILQQLPPSMRQAKPASAEDLLVFRAFAECMREQGIAEWPDPNPDGTFALEGTGLDGPPSVRLREARGACRERGLDYGQP